jgi:hypothetical protein
MLNSTYQRKAALALSMLNAALEIKQAILSLCPYSSDITRGTEFWNLSNLYNISASIYTRFAVKFENVVGVFGNSEVITKFFSEEQLRELLSTGLLRLCLPQLKEVDLNSVINLFTRISRADYVGMREVLKCIKMITISQVEMFFISLLWIIPVDQYVFPPPILNSLSPRTPFTYEAAFAYFSESIKLSRGRIVKSPLEELNPSLAKVFLEYPSLIFIISSSFREFLYSAIKLSLLQPQNSILLEIALLAWPILISMIYLGDLTTVIEIFNDFHNQSKFQLDFSSLLLSSSMLTYYLYSKCELYRRMEPSHVTFPNCSNDIDLYWFLLKSDSHNMQNIAICVRFIKVILVKEKNSWEKYQLSKLFDLSCPRNLNELWSLSREDCRCKVEIILLVRTALICLFKHQDRIEAFGECFVQFLDAFRLNLSLAETQTLYDLVLCSATLDFFVTLLCLQRQVAQKKLMNSFTPSEFSFAILFPSDFSVSPCDNFTHSFDGMVDSFGELFLNFVKKQSFSDLLIPNSHNSFNKIIVGVYHFLIYELAFHLNYFVPEPPIFDPNFMGTLQTGVFAWKYQRLREIYLFLSFTRQTHTPYETLNFVKTLTSTVQDIKLRFYRMLIESYFHTENSKICDQRILFKRLFAKVELFDENWLLTVLPLNGPVFLQWMSVLLKIDSNQELVPDDCVSFFVFLQLLSKQHESKWYPDQRPEISEFQDKLFALFSRKLIRIANSARFRIDHSYLLQSVKDATTLVSISKREGYLPFFHDIIEKSLNNDLCYEIHSVVLVILLSNRVPPAVQQFMWGKLIPPANSRYVNNLELLLTLFQCLFYPAIQTEVNETELINSRREIADVLRSLYCNFQYLSRLGVYYLFHFIFLSKSVVESRVEFLNRIFYESRFDQLFVTWLIQCFSYLYRFKCDSIFDFELFLKSDLPSDIDPEFLSIEITVANKSFTLKSLVRDEKEFS